MGRWAMTERSRAAVERSAHDLRIGPSSLHWDGNALTLEVAEVGAPLPRRIRGRVRVTPNAITSSRKILDAPGRHRWWPIAPHSRVEVALDTPGLTWSGSAYFDTNDGDEPLEAGFNRWDWSRADLADERVLLYEALRRDGSTISLGLRFDQNGEESVFVPPDRVALPPTLWRVPRGTRADDAAAVKVLKTLEDTPFYNRSMLETRLLGSSAVAMHESLCLDRFASQWVRLLLPFRMPRRFGG